MGIKAKPINHKIIRSYFEAKKINESDTIDMMEKLCSDINNKELYVPTFKNNYSQMKLDGPKSHGKIFEDDGEYVVIWHEVEDILMKYKLSFMSDGKRDK